MCVWGIAFYDTTWTYNNLCIQPFTTGHLGSLQTFTITKTEQEISTVLNIKPIQLTSLTAR